MVYSEKNIDAKKKWETISEQKHDMKNYVTNENLTDAMKTIQESVRAINGGHTVWKIYIFFNGHVKIS